MDEPWLQKLKEDPAVLAALLTGSRAEGTYDSFSDYDMFLVVDDQEKALKSGSWQHAFGRLVLFIPETLFLFGDKLPTRLALFEGGIKADFTIAPENVIGKMAHHPFPEEWGKGVKVLFDKTKKLEFLLQNGEFAKNSAIPQEAEFEKVVNEFWFEIYHVALYLKRGELWQAKFRERGILDMALLPMIAWYTLTREGAPASIPPGGKRLQRFTPKEIWERIPLIFSHFDVEEGWKSLFLLISLFQDMARETARKLGYPYPHPCEQEILGWVERLREGEGDNEK